MHFIFKIWHLVATILKIFLRINWPSFNLEARTLRSCIRLVHHFNTICHGRKTGHLVSRESLGRDAGQWGQNTERPGKYGTVGNPTCYQNGIRTRSKTGKTSGVGGSEWPHRASCLLCYEDPLWSCVCSPLRSFWGSWSVQSFAVFSSTVHP